MSCPICLEDLNENGRLTRCNHNFHNHCLDRWLETNNNCPLCREVLFERNNIFEDTDSEDEDYNPERLPSIIINGNNNIIIDTLNLTPFYLFITVLLYFILFR